MWQRVPARPMPRIAEMNRSSVHYWTDGVGLVDQTPPQTALVPSFC
jgi:hypothetical protein